MSDDTYVLVQLRETAAPDRVASRAARLPGVRSVTRVTGPFDLVIRMEWVPDGDPAVPLGSIRALPGVLRALACVRIPTDHAELAPAGAGEDRTADGRLAVEERAPGLPARPAR